MTPLHLLKREPIPNTPPDDFAYKIVLRLKEESRLAALSNELLVAECLGCDAADYLVVIEMMNRLDPNWSKESKPCP